MSLSWREDPEIAEAVRTFALAYFRLVLLDPKHTKDEFIDAWTICQRSGVPIETLTIRNQDEPQQ